MENLDVLTIISVILGVVATVFAGFWTKIKGKLGKVITAGKEFIDVGNALKRALADDKISKEEVDEIKKEWAEAMAAFKAILGK